MKTELKMWGPTPTLSPTRPFLIQPFLSSAFDNYQAGHNTQIILREPKRVALEDLEAKR